ncbi:hypothetical protein ACFQE1_07305 [Halobium palmae]|uniref:Uncharacterized protein n=1 Tax=Halobium palmae TaxID=1776492 RepID=A0ABD5RXK7_9EURY
MTRDGHIPGTVTYGVSAFAASHPRVVLTVVLTVLFVAMQGTVGAELPGMTPDAGASSDTGP